MSHGDFEHGDLTAEIFGLRWRAAVVDFTMQIFVKTPTGRTLTCEVEPTTKVGPALSIPISNLSGATGISIAKIKGSSSTSVLVKAAAQELARFWKGDGLPVRQYLETNVIKPPLSPG